MKPTLVVAIVVFAVAMGIQGLTLALDYFGFGPNTPTRQDRIEENLRRLEEEGQV